MAARAKFHWPTEVVVVKVILKSLHCFHIEEEQWIGSGSIVDAKCRWSMLHIVWSIGTKRGDSPYPHSTPPPLALLRFLQNQNLPKASKEYVIHASCTNLSPCHQELNMFTNIHSVFFYFGKEFFVFFCRKYDRAQKGVCYRVYHLWSQQSIQWRRPSPLLFT